MFGQARLSGRQTIDHVPRTTMLHRLFRGTGSSRDFIHIAAGNLRKRRSKPGGSDPGR